MEDFKEFDEFDLALALYHWLQHNWEGQGDDLYSDFCRLTEPGMYRPAPSEEYGEVLEKEGYESAKDIYDMLTRENYADALNRVLNYNSSDD